MSKFTKRCGILLDIFQPDEPLLSSEIDSSQQKLEMIATQYKQKMQSEQEFDRRFPRDDLGLSKKRPYRPKWMRNPLLFKILGEKGSYL